MGTTARSWLVAAALASAAGLTGCGEDSLVAPLPRQTVYPVSGSVTVKGKPAAGVRVSFVATQATDNRQFSSEPFTDADGTFRCTSYVPGDGLPAGTYEVRLSWPEQPNDDQRDAERDRLRGRYNSPSRPPFQVEVKAQPNQLPPFRIQ